MKPRWDHPAQDHLPGWLQGRIAELLAARSAEASWLRSSEKLLRELEALLADHDRLLRQLKEVYHDLDVANARIAQLEAARAIRCEQNAMGEGVDDAGHDRRD